LKKEKIEVLVVIGIGGSYLGAQAGINMIKGMTPFDTKCKVIFAGTSISSVDLVQKLKFVENKRFAINVISKSGKTLEPALAFRYFKHLLEEQVGPAMARQYIIATTDANNGGLLKIAKQNNYTTFVIPDNIGGRYSVLTPVGLFPFAFAGCDIEAIIQGSYSAYKKYQTKNLLKNDAYKYAVTRYLLSKKFNIELMVSYHPQMSSFTD
jgi:glucose-6-phosphate isomerase